MKDNLHERVLYSVEAPGVDPAVTRRAIVSGYSPDGTVVYLRDVLEDGREEKRELPVGQFLVRVIEAKLAGPDVLVEAGLAADPAAEREERRLSQPSTSQETRRMMGRRKPADHGAAAAAPDEFAEK